MANSLRELLTEFDGKKYATNAGTQMHEKLRLIRVLDDCVKVDSELKNRIKSVDGLPAFFVESAMTEVPIAGIINGNFVSRRIDRLVVDSENKIVCILDYKTDVDKTSRREKYVYQLAEYAKLMKQIYPDYKIETSILWLHDWVLEKL